MQSSHPIKKKTPLFVRHPQVLLLVGLEVLLGICASSISLILFYWVTEGVLSHQTQMFDQVVSQFIQSFRTPFLTPIMFFFTFLGGDMVVIGAMLVAVFLFWRRKRIEAFFFLFMIGMGMALNIFMKQFIARPRPPHPMYHEMFYSFPSGHSMNSFIFYAILVFGAFHFTRKKGLSVVAGILMLMIVGIIGISRIYLGVHYPSDVIGGFIAGFWWVITVLVMEKMYFFFRFLRTS